MQRSRPFSLIRGLLPCVDAVHRPVQADEAAAHTWASTDMRRGFRMKTPRALGPTLATLALCTGIGLAHAGTANEALPETMDMLKHAIGIHTVEGQHQVPVLAAYLADKLKAGGFAASDVEIIPVGETAALVAHYRGTGEGKPILLSGHMDVVAAKREDWARDPFTLVEENGYLYGRGTADMKTGVVLLVETLIRLKQEGFKPRHDLILLLSGDEETAMASTRELAKRYHDAEFLLNADSGGGTLDPASGKAVLYEIQAAEKTYADFQISLTSAGGHSSAPIRTMRSIDWRASSTASPPTSFRRSATRSRSARCVRSVRTRPARWARR